MPLLYEKRGAVGVLTLSPPQARNAWGAGYNAALKELLAQVALGILPAQGGTVRLARWVGRGQAMKVAMGFPLKAEEAYRIGLAQWLVPHDELMAKAMEVAEHVASLPPLAARLAKEAVAFGMDGSLREAANADLYRFMALARTEDKKEAHQAWRERRKPALNAREPPY